MRRAFVFDRALGNIYAPHVERSMHSLWARVREHKIIQWAVAYLGAALALAHGAEIVSDALHWPEGVWRVVVLALMVGFPIALTLAWYHGHKGLTQVNAGELWIISLLLLIGAVFFMGTLRTERAHDARADASEAVAGSGTDAAARAAGRPAAKPNMVAVTPFANRSADPDQESLADGLSDEIINSLNRVRGLTVTGASSSFYFKGKNENMRTIGEMLNADNVLGGSVQKSGDRLRVTAELVDVRSGRRLWGDSYERVFDDVFTIQDDITKKVAEALQIALGVGDLGSRPGMTRNVAAYEEFVKAMGLFREFRPDSFESSIEHFQRALALDESFSLAWIELASVCRFGAQEVPARNGEWRRLAVDAADRARKLTPDAPTVLEWDARRSADRGSWREAAAFYETRLPEISAKSGDYAAAAFGAGRFMWQVGRSGDAIRYLERARAVDPLDAAVALELGDAYADAGFPEVALKEFDRGLRLNGLRDPMVGFSLMTALATNSRDEIERRVALLSAQDPHVSLTPFLDDFAAGAAEIRRRAAADSPFEDTITPLVLAHWAAYYGDPDTALALLRGVPRELNSGEIAQTLWRPVFRNMRKLGGFKNLVTDLGLVDYWRKYGWSDFCRPVGERDFACE
jgi:TolB-like protein